MKKMYFVNAIPFLLWVIASGFGTVYNPFGLYYNLTFCIYALFAMFVIIPAIIIVINCCVAKSDDEFYKLDVILAFACSIGIFVYSILTNILNLDMYLIATGISLCFHEFMIVSVLVAIVIFLNFVFKTIKKWCKKLWRKSI